MGLEHKKTAGEQYPGGWKTGDTCVMITNKKKGYTNEYTIKGYDGQFFELWDRRRNFYRASAARLFHSRSEALASLQSNENGIQPVRIYTFSEHDVTISGEKQHLLDLAAFLRKADMDNIWTDLAYKIERQLDEDFRREVEL